ncbi:MAG: hypothetical protein CM15mV4_2670 [Caudoviricetes sp.]|nr:MAG: hypothetical protein CM15mV4_2670 [Caudoviricetes sp.]
MLVLDLYLDSVDVQRQLLGITTKPLLMYSAQKTMVYQFSLQQVLEDNGLISDPLTAGEENNGTVINTATTYPLTGTIDLTGVAETPKTNVFIGSGSLFTASGAAEIFVLDYESTYLLLLLVQLHSLGLEIMLDLDLYSVSVDVSRKSPSTITIVLLLYSHLQIMVLLQAATV